MAGQKGSGGNYGSNNKEQAMKQPDKALGFPIIYDKAEEESIKIEFGAYRTITQGENKMAKMNMEIKLDSTAIVELINSFNSEVDSLKAQLEIKDDEIKLLRQHMTEVRKILHINT